MAEFLQGWGPFLLAPALGVVVVAVWLLTSRLRKRDTDTHVVVYLDCRECDGTHYSVRQQVTTNRFGFPAVPADIGVGMRFVCPENRVALTMQEPKVLVEALESEGDQ